MKISPRPVYDVVKTALLMAVPMLLATAAHAGEPDWPERKITLQVQEQPLPDFLRELFRAAGLRALPSDALAGRVSGRFADRPEKIFSDVVKAYDLIPYYDGNVMHVAPARDMQSKSLRVPVGEIDRLQQALATSKLVDRYQSVEWSRDSGVVKLRGAPEFVHDVAELIATRVPRKQKAAPVRTAAQRVERAAEPALSHTLVFRTFPLRYASAADQVLNQNGKEVKIPGVVSLMRSMTGIGGSLVSSIAPLTTPSGASRPSLKGKGLRRFDQDQKDGGSSDDSPLGREEAPQVAAATVGDRQGIVRDESLYAVVEQRIRDCCAELGLEVQAWLDSPISGGDGNRGTDAGELVTLAQPGQRAGLGHHADMQAAIQHALLDFTGRCHADLNAHVRAALLQACQGVGDAHVRHCH